MTDILAVPEHRRGTLRDVSYELIAAGQKLTEESSGELHLAAIGGNVEGFAESLSRKSVDTIHTVSEGEEFNHDVYTQVLTQMAEELDPRVVLMPNTVNGLDYGPAVANRLGRPLVTDVIDASFDGSSLTATREMYGSKVETTIEVDADRVAMMIRDGEWPGVNELGDHLDPVLLLEIEFDAAFVLVYPTCAEEWSLTVVFQDRLMSPTLGHSTATTSAPTTEQSSASIDQYDRGRSSTCSPM